MTPETKFKIRVMKSLEQIPKIWFEKIQQKTICGTPDIVGTIGKYFFALELKKSAREKPDPIQKVKLYRISQCGALALEANPENWPECLAKLKTLADQQNLYKDFNPVRYSNELD